MKDRIGARMVLEAERTGRIKPGDTLVEPTSGNTGVGMAMASAVQGYNCVITLPQKMSQEKVSVLEALGAKVIRTPTEAAWDAPESHIGVAFKMQREDASKRTHVLDQYKNLNNPDAHYHGTGPEILRQCGGRVDMLVMTVGTGGTLTGVAKYFREASPQTVIVGVDPYGSILADPAKDKVGTYLVEGIGYDFIPEVLDRSLVHQWVKTEDKESFEHARMMHRMEGLLCGGSCGAALVGAARAAQGLGPDKRVVILLADSIRNYLTKFVDDAWMQHYGFLPKGIAARVPVEVMTKRNQELEAKVKQLEGELAKVRKSKL